MRAPCVLFLLLILPALILGSEQRTMQLEWGFGPRSAELYWDGRIAVRDGRLVTMRAVSFETDRHDQLDVPAFRSYTVNQGTDGMELVVEGGDATVVALESRQGNFEWSLRDLERKLELSFPSRDRGRLVVRLLATLGDAPLRLSDAKTQDSDPAACRLADGSLIVIWRAFLGLPGSGTIKGTDGAASPLGDQLRAVRVDREGKPGPVLDLLTRPGDVEAIAAAARPDGSCQIVWAEQRQANWDLFSCSLTVSADVTRLQRGDEVRLSEDPGVDRSPELAALPDGSLALVWQGWRVEGSVIHFRRWMDGRWQEPVRVSDGPANNWDPALAVSENGTVAVAWSRWQGGSYDVCVRTGLADRLGPEMLVAATERFEAHPSLAFDAAGNLWVAYEVGQMNWGMDSHAAGLRSERNVALRLVRQGRVERPRGATELKLPATLSNRSEMAHLARDGRGAMWLFFRGLGQRAVWEIYGSSLAGQGWTSPLKIASSAGGQDVPMASVVQADGRLRIFWTADHRVDPVGRDSYVYTSTMPDRAGSPLSLDAEPDEVRRSAEQTTSLPERPVHRTGDKSFGLYFGDLHRHTELSVCRTDADGSLNEAFRYAIDAAGLDFLCVTDHVQHVKILNDYDFWRTGKASDLHRVAGLHQPFHGYERSQKFPLGHRNIISLRRDVRRVPRTVDNRPWNANTSYPGEELIPPPELWARLIGQDVVTIPHTSTSPVMGTDFAYAPVAMEPVVEIYQGCRYTAEHANAPDPRRIRDNDPYGGKEQPAGYIWNALSKGYRYGFIASSDHVATHNSFTCVWAEQFSNASVLQAIAQRRCYAATDKIDCRMQMGPHLMGSEFKAAQVPPITIEVTGTAELDRIDVIRDNRVVYSRQPETPTRHARLQYQDTDVALGVHYYYARIIQKDRNMAWLSPIWVDLGKP